MANEIIRPVDLPDRPSPVASEKMVVDNGSTVAGATIASIVDAGRPLANQVEAEAGVNATKAMTPLTTKQAIDAQAVTSITAGDNVSIGGTPSAPVISATAELASGDKGDVSVITPTTQWRINRRYDTVAELLADTGTDPIGMGYAGSGASVIVSPGDRVSAGEFDYDVALSGASDQHVTTAGGVKLYEAGFVFTHIDRMARVAGDASISFARLTQDGRAGDFVWSGDDLSSQVTADTQKGVYVAPASDPSGASGAWVRQLEGNILASWFGGDLQAAVAVTALLGKQLYLGEKGDSYTITSGLTVPDGLTIFSNLFGGAGAKIVASNGNYRAVTLGQGSSIIGVEIEGPGNDAYNILSQGVYQIGERNFPLSPNYALGPTIVNCHIHGFRNAGIWLEYVDGFTIKDTRVDDVGYMGIAGLSVKNGNVLRCIVDGIAPGTNGNAYGVVMTRNSSDEVADPPSEDVTIENCEVRNNEIWHGFDTHSGIGIRFIDCITRNCTRGVFITASTNASASEVLGPKRCEVQNFQYLDPNPDRTKRSVAVYIGGAVSDSAEDCRASNIYAFGAGTDRTGGDRGGALILNRTKRTRVDGAILIEPLSWGLQLDYDNKDYSIVGLTVVDVNSDHYNNTAAILVLRSGNTGRILDFKLLKDKNNQGSYRNDIGIQTATLLTDFALTLGSGRNDMTTPTAYGTALTAYDN